MTLFSTQKSTLRHAFPHQQRSPIIEHKVALPLQNHSNFSINRFPNKTSRKDLKKIKQWDHLPASWKKDTGTTKARFSWRLFLTRQAYRFRIFPLCYIGKTPNKVASRKAARATIWRANNILSTMTCITGLVLSSRLRLTNSTKNSRILSENQRE